MRQTETLKKVSTTSDQDVGKPLKEIMESNKCRICGKFCMSPKSLEMHWKMSGKCKKKRLERIRQQFLAKWEAEVEESRRERISSGEAESDGQTVDQLPIEVVEAEGTDGKGGAFGPARRRKRNEARKRQRLKDEEEGIKPRPHRGGQRERICQNMAWQHFQCGADNDHME